MGMITRLNGGCHIRRFGFVSQCLVNFNALSVIVFSDDRIGTGNRHIKGQVSLLEIDLSQTKIGNHRLEIRAVRSSRIL